LRHTRLGALPFPLVPALLATYIATNAMAGFERFDLLYGKDTEVCRAYKQALEKIDFVQPPFCDRPVNPSMEALEESCALREDVESCKNRQLVSLPGFEPLKRSYLTAEEIRDLYNRVLGFQRYSNQLQRTGDSESVRNIETQMKLGRQSAWRYDVAPDVDNDGKPEPVLFWRATQSCHQRTDVPPAYALPVILSGNLTLIDETKTAAVFGNGDRSLRQGEYFKYLNYAEGLGQAGSVGVFRYRQRFYIDAWTAGFAKGKKRNKEDLKVYLYQDGQRTHLCTLYWNTSEERR